MPAPPIVSPGIEHRIPCERGDAGDLTGHERGHLRGPMSSSANEDAPKRVASGDDLVTDDHVDWLESQFFSQARLSQHDLEWGPVTPMPLGARRAMQAAIGMFAVAVVGLAAFVLYSNVIMPAAAPIGAEQPGSPPSAASVAVESPNG